MARVCCITQIVRMYSNDKGISDYDERVKDGSEGTLEVF